MKIQSVRVSLNPDTDHGYSTLKVEVRAGGYCHDVVIPMHEDDFVSAFDFIMDEARRHIIAAVKKQLPAPEFSDCCRVPMRIAGGGGEGSTMWHECKNCGKPCGWAKL